MAGCLRCERVGGGTCFGCAGGCGCVCVSVFVCSSHCVFISLDGATGAPGAAVHARHRRGRAAACRRARAALARCAVPWCVLTAERMLSMLIGVLYWFLFYFSHSLAPCASACLCSHCLCFACARTGRRLEKRARAVGGRRRVTHCRRVWWLGRRAAARCQGAAAAGMLLLAPGPSAMCAAIAVLLAVLSDACVAAAQVREIVAFVDEQINFASRCSACIPDGGKVCSCGRGAVRVDSTPLTLCSFLGGSLSSICG